MLKDRLGDVWKILPPRIRRLIVRATQPVFTVSVGAVIVNDEGKILLLNHLFRPKSGWGIPGGFIENGEQPEDGLRREVREETGLELKDVKLAKTRVVGAHLELLYCAGPDGEASVKSREILELGWFDADGIDERSGVRERKRIEEILRCRV